jgi:glutathione synthase/RimK-type ligase-like ATP-grasp enzyme
LTTRTQTSRSSVAQPPAIGIISHADDLHALVIGAELADRFGARSSIIEADDMWRTGHFSWRLGAPAANRLPTRDGGGVSAAELDVIWWRRVGGGQSLPQDTDPVVADIINNDCRAALMGSTLADFAGRWVNHPFATILAELKLAQLRVAAAAGFRVPKTLVSQEPEAIRHFCDDCGGRVIVKPVRGTLKRMLLTEFVHGDSMPDDASLRVAPAIFQEYIPGDQHIRANCFGDIVHAVSICTSELDWRRNLKVPMKGITLSVDVTRRLRVMLDRLGLRMGIIDLKIDPATSEPVFLEVNSQGQFLFIQGICGINLAGACAEFLVAEAQDARRLRPEQSGWERPLWPPA